MCGSILQYITATEPHTDTGSSVCISGHLKRDISTFPHFVSFIDSWQSQNDVSLNTPIFPDSKFSIDTCSDPGPGSNMASESISICINVVSLQCREKIFEHVLQSLNQHTFCFLRDTSRKVPRVRTLLGSMWQQWWADEWSMVSVSAAANQSSCPRYTANTSSQYVPGPGNIGTSISSASLLRYYWVLSISQWTQQHHTFALLYPCQGL